MPGSDDSVLLRKQGGISEIVFNRPQTLNAISTELAACFLHRCRQIEADPECRAVVIRGAGRAFMAGGDLSLFHRDFASPDAMDPLLLGRLIGRAVQESQLYVITHAAYDADIEARFQAIRRGSAWTQEALEREASEVRRLARRPEAD